MAADDELPRGWDQSVQGGTNGQTVITYPAAPNVSWVLTSAKWTASTYNQTIAQNGDILANGVSIGAYFVNAQSGLQFNTDDWTGQLEFPEGQALVVEFQGGLSGASELLSTSAYPV